MKRFGDGFFTSWIGLLLWAAFTWIIALVVIVGLWINR